jgi:hypothetical protein
LNVEQLDAVILRPDRQRCADVLWPVVTTNHRWFATETKAAA